MVDGSASPAPGWGLYVLAVLTFFASALMSLAASPDYTVPVSAALVSAILHFTCTWFCIRRGRSRGRYALLLLSVPLVVLTMDNLGRMSSILGGPVLRVLI